MVNIHRNSTWLIAQGIGEATNRYQQKNVLVEKDVSFAFYYPLKLFNQS
jgi:hypothetical protein